MDVEVRAIPAARVAVWRHDGPYSDLARVMALAMAWLREHREPGGAVTTVFLDPASLEPRDDPAPAAAEAAGEAGHDEHVGHEVRAELWLPLSPRFPLVDAQGEDVEVRSVPAVEAAVVEREGDPRELLPLARALRAFLAAKGFTVALETRIVHAMPSWDEFAAWRAEVQVPVERAPPRG